MMAKATLGSLLLGLALVLAAPRPAPAQYFGDDLEQQFLEEDDELFRQDEGGEFVEGEPDFTEGGEFVEEGELGVPGELSAEGRRAQLQLAADRATLPLNTAWGAGTGLLLGGWFAFISNGTSRETQRSIGMGIVLGSLMGALVGMRSVIDPDAPRAAQSPPGVEELRARNGAPPPTAPLVAVRGISAPSLSFRLRF